MILKHANDPIKTENALKIIKRSYVADLILHQISEEFWNDFTGDFELIGWLVFVEIIRNTHNSFRNNNVLRRRLPIIMVQTMLFSMIMFII